MAWSTAALRSGLTFGGPRSGLLAVDWHPGPPRMGVGTIYRTSLAHSLAQRLGANALFAGERPGVGRIRRRDLGIGRTARDSVYVGTIHEIPILVQSGL